MIETKKKVGESKSGTGKENGKEEQSMKDSVGNVTESSEWKNKRWKQ